MDKKIKFEVKAKTHPNGTVEKAIFIDNKYFDYSIDKIAYDTIKTKGTVYEKAAQEDITKHFAKSVSEFIGKKIEMEDIVRGIKTGWI